MWWWPRFGSALVLGRATTCSGAGVIGLGEHAACCARDVYLHDTEDRQRAIVAAVSDLAERERQGSFRVCSGSRSPNHSGPTVPLWRRCRSASGVIPGSAGATPGSGRPPPYAVTRPETGVTEPVTELMEWRLQAQHLAKSAPRPTLKPPMPQVQDHQADGDHAKHGSTKRGGRQQDPPPRPGDDPRELEHDERATGEDRQIRDGPSTAGLPRFSPYGHSTRVSGVVDEEKGASPASTSAVPSPMWAGASSWALRSCTSRGPSRCPSSWPPRSRRSLASTPTSS